MALGSVETLGFVETLGAALTEVLTGAGAIGASSAAGRNPYDRDLTELVGELSTRSEEFRQLWARYDVGFHLSGVKRFQHRDVGELELNYERLDVVFDTELTIFTYTADPGSRSAEARRLPDRERHLEFRRRSESVRRNPRTLGAALRSRGRASPDERGSTSPRSRREPA